MAATRPIVDPFRVVQMGQLYDINADKHYERSIFGGSVERFVSVTHNRSVDFSTTLTGRASDVMDSVGTHQEMKLSLMCGLSFSHGSKGKLFDAMRNSSAHAQMCVTADIKTVCERINIDDRELGELINCDVLTSVPTATHCIVGINYGAFASALVVTQSSGSGQKHDSEESTSWGVGGKVGVPAGPVNIDVGGSYENESGSSQGHESSQTAKHISAQIFMDGGLITESIPTGAGADEVLNFLGKVPKMIGAESNKCQQVSFLLIPLSSIPRFAERCANSLVMRTISDSIYHDLIELFEGYNSLIGRTTLILDGYKRYGDFIAPREIDFWKAQTKKVQLGEHEAKAVLRERIVGVRSGSVEASDLLDTVTDQGAKLEELRCAINAQWGRTQIERLEWFEVLERRTKSCPNIKMVRRDDRCYTITRDVPRSVIFYFTFDELDKLRQNETTFWTTFVQDARARLGEVDEEPKKKEVVKKEVAKKKEKKQPASMHDRMMADMFGQKMQLQGFGGGLQQFGGGFQQFGGGFVQQQHFGQPLSFGRSDLGDDEDDDDEENDDDEEDEGNGRFGGFGGIQSVRTETRMWTDEYGQVHQETRTFRSGDEPQKPKPKAVKAVEAPKPKTNVTPTLFLICSLDAGAEKAQVEGVERSNCVKVFEKATCIVENLATKSPTEDQWAKRVDEYIKKLAKDA